MKFAPIGRVEKPEELDFDPVVIPIVGYTADHQEVTTEISFHPTAPLGVALEMLRAVDANGNISTPAVLDYIDGCVMDESRADWDRLLNTGEVYFDTETWTAVYGALGEYYANRPSQRRPGSRGGRPRTQPTSRGAAGSRDSTPKASR